jgi:hypothetical protein
MKRLLTLTALAEAATGIALLAQPSQLISLLVGVPLDAPAALVAARVAGVALLSIGLVCWFARDDEAGRTMRSLVMSLLFYNAGAISVLVNARIALGSAGVGYWPVVLIHLALAVWCIACLRSTRESVAS